MELLFIFLFLIYNNDTDEQRNTEKNFPPLSKQDAREQSRPKRYSSQRQRNMPDVTYQEQPPQQQIQQESAVDTGAMFYKKGTSFTEIQACTPESVIFAFR